MVCTLQAAETGETWAGAVARLDGLLTAGGLPVAGGRKGGGAVGCALQMGRTAQVAVKAEAWAGAGARLGGRLQQRQQHGGLPHVCEVGQDLGDLVGGAGIQPRADLVHHQCLARAAVPKHHSLATWQRDVCTLLLI